MYPSSQVLDRIAVSFDDEHAVASAGLILPATTSQKLGLEAAADELVGVGYRPGRNVATVVHAMLASADCTDDIDIRRAGGTERVVGHDVAAPSTVGTWLRQFTFGHVRQLDRLAEPASAARSPAGQVIVGKGTVGADPGERGLQQGRAGGWAQDWHVDRSCPRGVPRMSAEVVNRGGSGRGHDGCEGDHDACTEEVPCRVA